MKKFISASLTSNKSLELNVILNADISKIRIVKNETITVLFEVIDIKKNEKFVTISIDLNNEFSYGENYEIVDETGERIFIDVTNAYQFSSFDKMFNYSLNDLGPTYFKDHTLFALWAPMASEVLISYFYEGETIIKPLKRTNKGVYRIRIDGDLNGVPYKYLVTNSGIKRSARDPYAKAVSLNSESSVVVDLKEVKPAKKKRYLGKSNILESFIYEIDIRDISIQNYTNILQKGKFIGLSEKNRKTNNGHKAGLDYISDLNISHVQLLPVCDFSGVDDLNFKKTYNWGYDNLSFFALEGSYSIDPQSPLSRLKEFMNLIDALHKKDIGVVLDVVFNHVYDYQNSDLEKIVPGYYFRHNEDGTMSNGSNCGDDIASERYMARKIIVDSALYFIDFYDIDGFRFDLLGMLDKRTIDELRRKALKIKPSILFYGEGWNILTPLIEEEKVSISNAFKNKEITFFNDTFRDIVKGSSFDIRQKGYVNGDPSYQNGMIYSFLGSAYKTIYDPKFANVAQSLNYIECHDNNTLFDKFAASNNDEDEETILKRVQLANAITIFSIGVPFIHMGQEIGLSKYGKDNSYNLLDKFNQMDYKIVEKRKEMIEEMKRMIALRKIIPFYKEKNISKFVTNFDFEDLGDGALLIRNRQVKIDRDIGELIFIMNPSKNTKFYALDEYYYYLSAHEDKPVYSRIMAKNLSIAPISFNVLFKIRGR
jgi:pullulanase